VVYRKEKRVALRCWVLVNRMSMHRLFEELGIRV
jgi:hypothetical protein